MNEKVRSLVEQMRRLEGELRTALHEQETRVLYQIEGTAVHFRGTVRRAHEGVRVGVVRWLKESSPRNVLSAPIIYSMIVPFAFLDLAITVYQQLCFRLYRIPRVQRSQFIVIDRHRLAYLNAIEKLNCVYCGYANGVVAYTREITSLTEQYWCPIKHARQVLGSHRRYAGFVDYGDAEAYRAKLPDKRAELTREAEEAEARKGS